MILPPSGSLVAGKYRLESLLGEGGMGAVFRARHEVMDKPVAVKWLKSTSGDQVAARHRFVQEARAAARIRHPNVVDVYDVGEQDGCLFMVMELLEGETFGDFLERSGVPIAEAIRHLLAAMRGVAAAHAAGITHRDIKPENVFIAVDTLHVEGVAKILDFGISKLHDEPQPTLTLQGTTMGTPHYMSYDQIRCMSDVDHRTDIYAFGVLLYQALTGALPYDADTLPGLVMQAAAGRATRPIELRPDLPPELDELVMKAIALRPDDRFQNMDAMINALTRIQLARYAWSASAERTSWTPRSPAPAAAMLLGTPRPPGGKREQAPQASFFARARKLPTIRLFAGTDTRPPRLAARAKAAPLNPWLGLTGVGLGIILGGAVYARLMTPSSAASAKASASAPVDARAPVPGSRTQAPAGSTHNAPSLSARADVSTDSTSTRATATQSPLTPGRSSRTSAETAAQPASKPPTPTAQPMGRLEVSPPTSQGQSASAAATHAPAEPARAAPTATPPATKPTAQRPSAELRLRTGAPSASAARAPVQPPAAAAPLGSSAARPGAATPADEPAPSPAAHAHRSGPLKLEDL